MNNSREDFLKKRPEMKEMTQSPLTVAEHTAAIIPLISPGTEKSIFRHIIVEETARILKDRIATEKLNTQLINFPILSYADHHSLLNYKLLYNSNLICAEIIKKLNLPFLVVGATGNIPLKNEAFPRGFYFKGKKFNFFSVKDEKKSVYLLDNKLRANKKIGIKSFITNYDQNGLTSDEIKFLHCLFFEGLEIEHATTQYDIFSDQLTFLNFKLWKYYFDQGIRTQIPDIIYLQANQLVNRVLLEELKKADSLISLILFEPGLRNLYVENFQGIQGCWDEDRGSHFFWGSGKKNERVSLHVDDQANALVGKDFILELTPTAISTAVEQKEIFPSLFFDFLINTFLAGYVALGGFNQLKYLPQMKEAHIKCLQTYGLKDMAQQFANRKTGGFVCGMLPFHFDSGIDLIWHYNSTNGKFNGNLSGGLGQKELTHLLEMKISDLTTAAIDTMIENTSSNE